MIEATILTGCGKGETVFIPRIPIIPSNIPFQFKRLQFPVRLSFAMSINKSQGQILKVAGLQLEEPCFSHGQLYVGTSRVGTKTNLYVYATQNKTKNIVYKEISILMQDDLLIIIKCVICLCVFISSNFLYSFETFCISLN